MNTFKTFLLASFVVLGSVSCGSKNKERSEYDLFPVPHTSLNSLTLSEPSPKYKDKDGQPVSGYINRDGQLVINLQFDYADVFSNGLARVMTGKKFGYINSNGEFVIKPQFDHAENFGSGDAPLALVKVGNKHGYIDKSGNYAISPQFDDAGRFTPFFTEVPGKVSLTLARVKVGDKWGFIDKSGNQVIPPQFSWAGSFSDGRAVAQVGDKCGYINADGQMVIEPKSYCEVEYGVRFKGPGDFSSGLARVAVEDNPPPSSTPTPTKTPTRSSGDIVYPGIVERKFKYGFIDRRGKFVIEPQFDAAMDFSGGLAAVGFTKGLTVLRLQERSDGGTTPIEKPQLITKWGFINETGTVVINPSFDSVENFSHIVMSVVSGVSGEWLAEVEIDDDFGRRCGYIDRTGKYVIDPQFSASTINPFFSGCSSFSTGGFASVGADYSGGSVIDNKGKTIFTYRR